MSDVLNKGSVAWFASNPVAANLLMLVLLLMGIVTALSLRTESFPSVPADTVLIDVTYNGGSPEDSEEGVAVKIENALDGVPGIKNIISHSTESGVTVDVVKQDGYPLNRLMEDVKQRVDSINNLPDQSERPVITQELEQVRHVIYVQLFGDTDEKTLKQAANRVRDELLLLEDVNQVTSYGERSYEINIEVPEENLRRFGLTFDEIVNAVRNNSINQSAGTLQTTAGRILLQTREQSYYGREFGDITLRSTASGVDIKLKDVALIHDGFVNEEVFSTFSGKRSIALDVQLIGQESITAASERVQQRVEELKQASWLPQSVKITTWYNEAAFIEERLGLMLKNAFQGMLLVFVILALFMNLRLALWVALGIPVSFAGTLWLMGPEYLNYSLNELTTFGFIIVLGIVVDDAIVVGENIFSAKRRYGQGLDTTVRGAKEVAVPATFGVLTTIAAFYPLTLIDGQMGSLFAQIVVVVIFCLLFSLVESKWILPAHLVPVDVCRNEKPRGIARLWQSLQIKIDHGLQCLIQHYYLPLLHNMIRWRYLALAGFLSLLIIAVGMIPAGKVRSVFLPDIVGGVVFGDVTFDQGLGTQRAQQIAKYIDAGLKTAGDELKQEFSLEIDPVKAVFTYVTDDQSASVIGELASASERNYQVRDVLNRWRELTNDLPGVKSVDFYTDFDSEKDIEVEIRGPDLGALSLAALQLQSYLVAYQGVYDIENSFADTAPELTIHLKPQAAAFGLTQSDLAAQLRQGYYGEVAQQIQRGRDEIDVRVRYPHYQRQNIADLENIRIRTQDGASVPFTTVADLEFTNALSEIKRVDKYREVTVSARVDKAIILPDEILDSLQLDFFKKLLSDFPSIHINLDGEAAEEEQASASLIKGFILSLFLIFALLAIPLKSYIQPLVIMSVIPFGIIGAIFGHWLNDLPLSLLSFFGLLALSGVVVNDSLVLTSRYNAIREQGLSYQQAIVKAGRSRFRAILLTSLTTFMGLSPLMAETSEQAQFMIPMAVSLAYGIVFATTITLFLVPIMLGIARDLGALSSRFTKQLRPFAGST